MGAKARDASGSRILVGVFGFEELNSLALFNGLIWRERNRLTRDFDVFVAYVPPGFRHLAFEADYSIELPSGLLPYRNYSEVNEYLPGRESVVVRAALSIQRRFGYLLIRTVRSLGLSSTAVLQVQRLVATPRMKRFLFRSGAWRWVQRDARSRFVNADCQFIVVSDFTTVESGAVVLTSPDLKESFARRFAHLANALRSGMRMQAGDPPSRTLLFRTRNYSAKAAEHNTRSADVLPLIQIALSRGWRVINVGAPALHLDITHAGYEEISDELTLDQEFELLPAPVVQRGDAGLFTWVVGTPGPLCALGPEWSTSILGGEFSLMAARGGLQPDLELDYSPDREERFSSWLENLERIS